MALAPEQVGRRIAEARKQKGWTHQQLADAMGVGLRTAQRWQIGKNPKDGKSWLPRLGTLMEVAEVLDVPRSWFVEDEAPIPADEAEQLRHEVSELREESRRQHEELLALLRGARRDRTGTDG